MLPTTQKACLVGVRSSKVMSSQGEKGLTKMAATAKDDATATLKGDDDEKDFGQEANQEKAKAKGKEKMPMVKLKKTMMQRRTEEKMPMVKLTVTKKKLS